MTEGRRMEQDIAEILLDKATIQARVAELGAQLTKDYQGKEVIMICILEGAVVFYADGSCQVPSANPFRAYSAKTYSFDYSGVIGGIYELGTAYNETYHF